MNPAPQTATLIRERLAVLSPSRLEIDDQSHLHVGHAGARQGGHYHLKIVATAFAGKSTIARHRQIYDALGDLMQTHIHALSIEAASPEEV